MRRPASKRKGRRESAYFFFQAEDGIRDYKVTGVQTCALPILLEDWQMSAPEMEAIQERLKKLRADEVLVAEQLDRLQAQKAALEHRQAMIQDRKSVV